MAPRARRSVFIRLFSEDPQESSEAFRAIMFAVMGPFLAADRALARMSDRAAARQRSRRARRRERRAQRRGEAA
jgi:hypothetical protein